MLAPVNCPAAGARREEEKVEEWKYAIMISYR